MTTTDSFAFEGVSPLPVNHCGKPQIQDLQTLLLYKVCIFMIHLFVGILLKVVFLQTNIFLIFLASCLSADDIIRPTRNFPREIITYELEDSSVLICILYISLHC